MAWLGRVDQKEVMVVVVVAVVVMVSFLSI